MTESALEEVRRRLRPLILDPDDPVYPGSPDAPVEVAVSRNSISRVVVEKGLAAGDRIALRDPTAAPRTPGSASGPGGRPERGP